LVLGLLLFVLDGKLNSSTKNDRFIFVGMDTQKELTTLFEKSRGRLPTRQELEKLVAAWLKNELLYREGLAFGLDRGDDMIRKRVIHKMR
jgi:hypothetical protein